MPQNLATPLINNQLYCTLQTIHALRKMEITGITVGSV